MKIVGIDFTIFQKSMTDSITEHQRTVNLSSYPEDRMASKIAAIMLSSLLNAVERSALIEEEEKPVDAFMANFHAMLDEELGLDPGVKGFQKLDRLVEDFKLDMKSDIACIKGAIKRTFGITIGYNELRKATTLGELADLIKLRKEGV